MTGEDCRVANAPRNDKYVSFHSNDKYVSFHNNDRVGCRGGNPLLCHCERSAAIIPRFHNNDKYVSFHSNDRAMALPLAITFQQLPYSCENTCYTFTYWA